MAGIGAGLGAAALEWEMKKQDEKEATQRKIEAVAAMSNMEALEKFDDQSTEVGPVGEFDIYDEDHNLGKGFYNPYTKKYGNKAYRNNNPGNITGMSGKLLRGAARLAHNKFGDKGDQIQQVYDTPAAGWKAMYGLMKDKYSKGTIRNSFSKWQSDQKAWGKMKDDLVASGINIDKGFMDLNLEDRMVLMNQRAHHEGWTGAKLTDPSIFSL